MKPLAINGPSGQLPLREDDPIATDLAMLIAGETSGRPLEEVLAEFSRSRSSYYEKLRRFRERGIVGLLSRPPGPRGPWKRSYDVLRMIVSARLRAPSKSAAQIQQQLTEAGYPVSLRSVERTLSDFGLVDTRAGPPTEMEDEPWP